MKIKKIGVLLLLLGSALLPLSSAMATYQLGVDFTGGGYPQNPEYPQNYGYEFQVTSTVTVVELAAYDGNAPCGLTADVPVGLWDATPGPNYGNLLASATITQGTLPNLGAADLFAGIGITPITLTPGYYDVAAVVGGILGDGYTQGYPGTGLSLTDFSVAPGITYVTNAYNLSTNLAFPVLNYSFPGLTYEGAFGGDVVLGSPVPEPSTIIAGALLLLPFGTSTIRFLRKQCAA